MKKSFFHKARLFCFSTFFFTLSEKMITRSSKQRFKLIIRSEYCRTIDRNEYKRIVCLQRIRIYTSWWWGFLLQSYIIFCKTLIFVLIKETIVYFQNRKAKKYRRNSKKSPTFSLSSPPFFQLNGQMYFWKGDNALLFIPKHPCFFVFFLATRQK